MLLLFPGTENQTEETFFCTEKHWSGISFFLKEVAGAEDGRECVVWAGGVFSWWAWFGQIHPSLRRTLLSTSEVLKHGRQNFFFSVVGPYGQILKPEHASFVKQYTLFGNPRKKTTGEYQNFLPALSARTVFLCIFRKKVGCSREVSPDPRTRS